MSIIRSICLVSVRFMRQDVVGLISGVMVIRSVELHSLLRFAPALGDFTSHPR